MYVLGTITDSTPQLAGAEVIMTDAKTFLVRTPANQITPLSREQLAVLIQGDGAVQVAWVTPETTQQLLAFLAGQAEQERRDTEASLARDSQTARIDAENELDGLRNMQRGRRVLSIALGLLMAVGLGLGVWGILDRPTPPQRATKQTAEGTVLSHNLPELSASTYVAAGEVGTRLTGYFSNTPLTVKTSSREIIENFMLSPQTSDIPLHLRPLSVLTSGYQQTPLVVDQGTGSVGLYADNADSSHPDFYNLQYVDLHSMQTRELVAGSTVLSNQKSRIEADSSGSNVAPELESWDRVGGFAISDRRILLTAIYYDTNQDKRRSSLLWYDTSSLNMAGSSSGDLKPLEVNPADKDYKDTPVISKDPNGKGYWIAYLGHPDRKDSTHDGYLVVIHAVDEAAVSSPTTGGAAAFYVDQFSRRAKDAPGVHQSQPQLLDDRLLYVDSNKVYLMNLSTFNNEGATPVAAAPRVITAAPASIPPRLLRDYTGAYYVIVVDKDQRILAYPEAGGDPIVVSESKGVKVDVSTFRSHVVWLEKSADGGVDLRENAVFSADSAVIRFGGPAASTVPASTTPTPAAAVPTKETTPTK